MISKECIEQIEKISQVSLNPKSCASGMKEALTNPKIYESANLIPLDEALAFAEWANKYSVESIIKMGPQLYTIFKQKTHGK